MITISLSQKLSISQAFAIGLMHFQSSVSPRVAIAADSPRSRSAVELNSLKTSHLTNERQKMSKQLKSDQERHASDIPSGGKPIVNETNLADFTAIRVELETVELNMQSRILKVDELGGDMEEYQDTIKILQQAIERLKRLTEAATRNHTRFFKSVYRWHKNGRVSSNFARTASTELDRELLLESAHVTFQILDELVGALQN